MNKTITINIAGLFFHIDEDAYNKLSDYLTSIKNSLPNEGKEEVINDVESRIAELFNEMIDPKFGVVRLTEVDHVIKTMGQPEDYRLDDAEYEGSTSSASWQDTMNVKKLYRDKDRGVFGGVLAGLGHYFNIDPVWLRIIFILLVFAYGLSFIIYPILWLIIPKARTTAEILEMKGQVVNLDNIEKSIRENFNEMGERIKSLDTSPVRQMGNSAAQILSKILGIVFMIMGITGIIGAFISSFTIFKLSSAEFHGFPMRTIIAEGYAEWAVSLTMFGMISLPSFLFLLVGLKLIYKNIRYVGIVAIILTILWGACITFFAIFMIDIDTKKDAFWKELFIDSYKTTVVKKTFDALDQDTLQVEFVRDPRFYGINDTLTSGDFFEEHYDVRLEIVETLQTAPYVEIKTKAFHDFKNKTTLSSKHIEIEHIEEPSMLDYYIQINKNKIDLANALIYSKNSDFIENNVKITLYLPKDKWVSLPLDQNVFIENQGIKAGRHAYRFENGQLITLP